MRNPSRQYLHVHPHDSTLPEYRVMPGEGSLMSAAASERLILALR